MKELSEITKEIQSLFPEMTDELLELIYKYVNCRNILELKELKVKKYTKR